MPLCVGGHILKKKAYTHDKKISATWMEAGFGSEQTLFKTFRAATGLSPKEWIQQEKD